MTRPVSRVLQGAAMAMLGAHAATGGLAAQPATVIPSTVACRTCRIELARMVTLGSPGDTISPGDFQTGVARDSRGRYYLAPTADLAVMAVYDSAGRFVRTIGRQGRGPGEYGYIVRAEVVRGDTVLALDEINRRLTVLSPAHAVVRSVALHGRFTRVFPLGDGRLLASGIVRTSTSAGLPLHMLGHDGAVLRSFGSLQPEAATRTRTHVDLRWVEMANAREVWTARLDRYEIELWSIEGKLVRSFRRDADWFPPWDYSRPHPWDAPPRPMPVAVWPDAAGRVWTLVRVPSAEWKAPSGSRSGREGPPVPPFDVQDRYADTIVEVFDPSTGALLASQGVSQYLVGSIGGDAVYSLRATDDGDLRIDIWRVRLRQ